MTEDPTADRFAETIRDLISVVLLRLYVVGATSGSQRAIGNLREICETELAGRYELEVIDIYQQPTLGAGQQNIAAPTLVKELPLPVRRLVGDMSDREPCCSGLDLRPIES